MNKNEKTIFVMCSFANIVIWLSGEWNIPLLNLYFASIYNKPQKIGAIC